MKRLCLSIFLLMSCLIAGAEGLPFSPIVRNWSARDSHASKQNWSVCQADDGVVFIGNNRSLLEFDGYSWRSYDLADGNSIRFVFADGERIYIGSYREFGYWDRKAEEYVSLSGMLERDSFGDEEVWNICKAADGSIIFQSFGAFFVFDGEKVIPRQGIFPLNLFNVRGKLFSQQIDGGFFHVHDDGTLAEELIGYLGQGHQVVAALPYGEDDVLLLTFNQGIKIWRKDGRVSPFVTDFEDKLRTNTFNRGCKTRDGLFVLGSTTGGVFACDSLGHLQWVADTGNGLQNNTVLGFTCDRDNNVWVALDDGVSLIQNNSEIARYKPYHEDIGMVYDVLDYDGRFYAATNQGLFVYSGGRLKGLTSEKEQVWYVKAFDGQILAGNNTGTLSVVGENAYKELRPGSKLGSFCIKRAYLSDGNVYLVEGSYYGLNIYRKSDGGKWTFRNSIDGVSLSRRVEVDNSGQIWCQHIHGGLRKITLDDSMTRIEEMVEFNELGGVKDRLFPLFKVNGAICSYNGEEFFIYEQMQEKFVPSELMNSSLSGLKGVHDVIPADGRNYWFVGDDQALLVKVEGNAIRQLRDIDYSLFGEYFEENSSMVYDSEERVSYLCLANQVIRIADNPVSRAGYETDLSLFCLSAQNKDQEVQDVLQDPKHRFRPGFNSVRILLRYPRYISDNLSMQSRLVGLSEKWSSGALKMQHDFFGLRAGTYKFEARICDQDEVLDSIEVPFVIKRPWYLSNLMILLYLLLGAAGVILTERLVTYLKSIYEVQAEKARLESALKDKDNELATMAAKGLAIDDDNWEMFRRNLDRMDEKFFVKLQNAYPSLTSADLRFCALLRMNLSTKEIANTLNLTTRGVESARYRLRKKFGLEASDSLTGFIINFTQSQGKESE